VVGIQQHWIDSARQQLKMHMYLYKYEANDNEVTPPSKKPRVVAQPFDDMYKIEEDDASGSSVQSPVSNFENRIGMEFKAYFAYTFTNEDMMRSEKDGQFQVLIWWKLFGVQLFPMMPQVAQSVLCVPASSAIMSENNFSDAGNTITKKRNRLKLEAQGCQQPGVHAIKLRPVPQLISSLPVTFPANDPISGFKQTGFLCQHNDFA
jgi:hAT family C-terminal dimerisation region